MLRYVPLIRMVNTFRDHSPMQWARAEPIFAGVMHKCFLQVVDPVRFLEDRDYAAQVLQAEQVDYI